LSIVSTSAIALTTSAARPTTAEPAGLARELRQVAEHLARDVHPAPGSRTSQPCRFACSLPNMGKAVNSARATVKNGTSAIVVVNVRLLA
jgi:hypothetical protein